MSQSALLHLLKEALLTAGLVSAPALAAILVVGLLVSVLQVATQIQEMTLTFIPKLAVTVLVLVIFGGWMLSTVKQFAITSILQSAVP